MHISIDLAAVRETARRGVRRTAVFLGLGLNASRDPALTNYELADLSPIQIVPSNVAAETLSHFKGEFGRWTITCGLRELIETFAVFLDQIHHACLLMSTNKNLTSQEDATVWGRSYPFKGVDDKLKKLKSRFNVEPRHARHLASIQALRNCFTHRRGIVGHEDCSDGAKMQLSWMGFDIIGEHTEGQTVALSLPLTEPVHFPDGGTIGLRYTERIREFNLVQRIDLDPRDLIEICNFVLLSADEITTSIATFAKAIGIAERNSSGES